MCQGRSTPIISIYLGMVINPIVGVYIAIIKGSLVEKLPSYGDLKMQRVQYSNSSSSSAK